LPLSEATKAGLKACHFSTLTDIQARAIAPALRGRDILGAARTGSGKTLAFVIPVLENLYRAQCIGADAGLGAMIISPTRELAIQIFDVLFKIGKHGHLFAAGLVIGGKSLQEEQAALARMNIVVCTPGRMLQHLSQTATFSVDSLQMLVLDEADRIMDMGFKRDVDAIIEYLPPDRQTLLFSATQTKKVSDLARLSLKDPEYVAVHEGSASATPKGLQQNYVITPLPTKLDTLWSFIQSGKKSKILVFLSSGKQVRFVYESFRRMQPGIPLLHLHGRQKQTARLDITTKFSAARHSCLFATDVVARGIDFPAVDWVVQVDCPEDADTYIHRVGRTARYERDGRAVLFLDPSEEAGMLERLASKKVPIERINIRAKKQSSVKAQLQGMCFKDPELKYLGQKAFSSYVRSIHIQKDKEVFKINEYPLEEFAASLGLPGAPRIKFMKGDIEAARRLKNAPRATVSDSDSASSADEQEIAPKTSKDKAVVRTKYDRMFERQNQDVFSGHYGRMIADDEETADHADRGAGDAKGDEDDDDFLVVKRRIPASPPPAVSDVDDSEDEDDDDAPAAPTDLHKLTQTANGVTVPLLIDSKRRIKALKSKKKMAKLIGATGGKLVFDDVTGEARPAHPFADEASIANKPAARAAFVEEEKARLAERDVRDREVQKEKRRVKKEKRREREKGGAGDGDDSEGEDNGLEIIDKPFAELAGLYGENDDDDDEATVKTSEKRPKKWFEYASDAEDGGAAQVNKKARRQQQQQQQQIAEPETLEDLEALASGLLA